MAPIPRRISGAGFLHLRFLRQFDLCDWYDVSANIGHPRVKTLHKIALAFNMTLAEFLDFDELNAYSFEDDTEE